MRFLLLSVAAVTISGLGFTYDAKAEEQAVPPGELPKAVTEAVTKMFPKAQMVRASQEEEDGKVEYEVTVKENGKQIDITLKANGEIEELEKEIDPKSLPKAQLDAIEMKYPKAVLKKIEAVFEVEDGKEELEFYEITLETADKETLEVKIDDKGQIKDGHQEGHQGENEWTKDFTADKDDLESIGRNPVFRFGAGLSTGSRRQS